MRKPVSLLIFAILILSSLTFPQTKATTTYLSDDFTTFPSGWSSTTYSGNVYRATTTYVSPSYSAMPYTWSTTGIAYTQHPLAMTGATSVHVQFWFEIGDGWGNYLNDNIRTLMYLVTTSTTPNQQFMRLGYRWDGANFYLVSSESSVQDFASWDVVWVLTPGNWYKIDCWRVVGQAGIQISVNDVNTNTFTCQPDSAPPNLVMFGDVSSSSDSGYFAVDDILINADTSSGAPPPVGPSDYYISLTATYQTFPASTTGFFDPAGPSIGVTSNTDQTIKFKIFSGEHPDYYLIDGNNQGDFNFADDWTYNGTAGYWWYDYTFSAVTSNHTIDVYAHQNQGILYNITSSAGAGGVIDPSGNLVVNSGAYRLYHIIPNFGYTIANVTVDAVNEGLQNYWLFGPVTSDHTISATFSLVTGGGGSNGTTAYNYVVNLRRFENGSLCSTPYNATVVYTNGQGAQVSISADGYSLGSDYPIYTFTYPVGGTLGNTRTLYYPSSPITPIIPSDITNSATYFFTIRDPTSYLSGKTAYVDAKKVIVGTEEVLSSSLVSGKQHQVWFLLQQNQLIHLTLRYGNATVYDFGYFMPTTSNINGNYLDMWMFGFTSGMWHMGQLIKVDSYWSGGDIIALYGVTRDTTLNATLTVTDRENSTIIYSGSVASNTTWTVPANSSRAYIVAMTGYHSLLTGAWTYVKILDPTTFTFPAFPTLPTNWTLGGLSLVTFAEFAIPAFFLFMFSYKWRNIGMVAAMLIATVQWGIGWAPFWTWELLAVGWMWALGWSVVIMESG